MHLLHAGSNHINYKNALFAAAISAAKKGIGNSKIYTPTIYDISYCGVLHFLSEVL